MKKQYVVAAAIGALLMMPAIAKADLGSTMDNTTNSVGDAASDAGNAISNTTNSVTGSVKRAVSPNSSTLSSSDQDFVNGAAQGGMIEIMDSKLAKKMSSNDSVKSFAQTMIDDHKKANDKLKRIAKKLNVTVPSKLDADKQAQYDSLKTANTSSFDQMYMQAQDKDHNEAINVFQKEADNGDNAMLKDFAAKTLPVLQGHMQMVKQLESKVPAAATSNQ